VADDTAWRRVKPFENAQCRLRSCKARGKKLVRWVEHSRRYVVCTRGRPSKNISPLDQHYLAIREELHRTFNTLGLVA
jgi:hypothetical protein